MESRTGVVEILFRERDGGRVLNLQRGLISVVLSS